MIQEMAGYEQRCALEASERGLGVIRGAWLWAVCEHLGDHLGGEAGCDQIWLHVSRDVSEGRWAGCDRGAWVMSRRMASGEDCV